MSQTILTPLRPSAAYAPPLRWTVLVRALLRHPFSDSDLAKPWLRDGDAGFWVGYTSSSLRMLAQLRSGDDVGGSTPCIWIPGYFCNSALEELRRINARLVFYPVTRDNEPDYARCRQLAGSSRPDIFLLVHYFGAPANANSAAEFCQRNGAWLVEDAAHVYLPTCGVGEKGDFVLYSPHKHLSLPHGALLVARPTPALIDPVTREQQLAKIARLAAGDQQVEVLSLWSWVAKRLAQGLGIYRRPSPVDYLTDLPSTWRSSGVRMSPLARRLLSALLKELGWIQRLRQQNSQVWRSLFPTETESTIARPKAQSYIVTCEFPSQKEAQAFHDRMRAAGVPATTWPDLPPEMLDEASVGAGVKLKRTTRVFLHVHQGLKLKSIAKSVMAGLSKAPVSQYVFAWFSGPESDWTRWYSQALRPNLVQSWTYAQAKARTENLRLKRGVFSLNGEPVAIMIAMRRFPGVWRVNRGPLVLRVLTEAEEAGMYRELGRLFTGQVLSIAPDLEAGGRQWLTLAGAGYRRRAQQPWSTVWLDLAQNQEVLRAALAGKWRNALSFAERSSLDLLCDPSDEAVSWMFERHEEAMRERTFSATPTSMLRALDQAGSLQIYRAAHAGRIIAGIGIARHGKGATYLIGWNGPDGRHLKANQFLLWHAMQVEKSQGVNQFDLGGIDELNQPGIAEFKLGMGGSRVELVGEYLHI